MKHVEELESRYTYSQLVEMQNAAIANVLKAQELINALQAETYAFAHKIEWETVADLQSRSQGMETLSDSLNLLHASRMLGSVLVSLRNTAVAHHLRENAKAEE